jgi:hypothetical protein
MATMAIARLRQIIVTVFMAKFGLVSPEIASIGMVRITQA